MRLSRKGLGRKGLGRKGLGRKGLGKKGRGRKGLGRKELGRKGLGRRWGSRSDMLVAGLYRHGHWTVYHLLVLTQFGYNRAGCCR